MAKLKREYIIYLEINVINPNTNYQHFHQMNCAGLQLSCKLSGPQFSLMKINSQVKIKSLCILRLLGILILMQLFTCVGPNEC